MSSATQSTILTFEDARHLIEQHAANLRPHGRELLDLLEANGRALAEPITADRDFPPFRRATRDGYAVRAADLAAVPTTLEVVAEAKAGGALVPPIVSGQAVSIMTGAPVPDGADAIVMVELTSRAGNRVEVQRTINPGDNIVPVGAEGKKGDVMLAPGMRLDYAAIGVAAAVGLSRLVVYSRPRIAVLSTGDEVVDIDVPPGPNQIRNSNSYSLAIQITQAGGEPVLLPIAPDEPNRLHELLREGLEGDLLLIAGGVSMGKYDLVEEVLSELEAEFFFTGAQIQPGKPVVFGAVPLGAGAHESSASHKYFLGLPGNPISTMVCFELFARPLVEALAGMQERKLSFVYAKLKTEIKTKLGLKRFLPANLLGEFEDSEVELVKWQGSGDLGAVARSNCYIVIPPDRERIPAGEFVPVLLR
ncbi:MAG: molybdopterin molybdenumtransferase MoeA [Acidobacteria bacterium]|nr:MAG: molybdopterin molybdenumtransferase MoeA [Acidobacteriota bacterium]